MTTCSEKFEVEKETWRNLEKYFERTHALSHYQNALKALRKKLKKETFLQKLPISAHVDEESDAKPPPGQNAPTGETRGVQEKLEVLRRNLSGETQRKKVVKKWSRSGKCMCLEYLLDASIRTSRRMCVSLDVALCLKQPTIENIEK